MANNPAKLKPNHFIIDGDVIKIIVESKKGIFECLVDKKVFETNSDINQTHWSLSSYKYLEACKTIGNKHKKKYLHKLILPSKKGIITDHINGNTLDNRMINLRHLTHVNNIRNQRIRNSIGINGARYVNTLGQKRIALKFSTGGKHISLGIFDTFEEALKARIKAEEKYWGHSFLKEKFVI